MLSVNRAAALLVFAGLFAATLAGQAGAASTAAVAASEDDALLTRLTEAAKLRALTAASNSASSRKLLDKKFTDAQLKTFLDEVLALFKSGELTESSGKQAFTNTFGPSYTRSLLMSLQDSS